MKTTVEIPDTTLRRAKTMAAAKGMKLKELLVEAIEDKVSNGGKTSKASEPAWMKLHGAFAKTRAMRAETRRIQRVIDGEFEQIDPENWK
jgi:hypothetical protein